MSVKKRTITPYMEQTSLADFTDPEVIKKLLMESQRARERRHQRELITAKQERIMEWRKRNLEEVRRIVEERERRKKEKAKTANNTSKPATQ